MVSWQLSYQRALKKNQNRWFLCSDFNIEENKQHFQHIMLYYFKKAKNTTETQKKICAVYGEAAVTDWMSQKWFVKFLGTTDILAK